MADNYLSAAYINGHLGTAYHTAVTGLTGVNTTTIGEAATAVIQTAMRNSGYTPPTSTDGTGVEEAVKLGTYGCYREMLATVPEKAIALPESWATHPAKVMYDAILNGNAKLAAEPSQAGAVGGMAFTSASEDVEGGRPPRASREELEQW